jgi:hypothetical protein
MYITTAPHKASNHRTHTPKKQRSGICIHRSAYARGCRAASPLPPIEANMVGVRITLLWRRQCQYSRTKTNIVGQRGEIVRAAQ